MNIKKVEYSIKRSYKIFNAKNKYKDKKIIKCMSAFYKEGIENREEALNLREETLKRTKYDMRGKNQDYYGFIDYCENSKILNKLFNLL